DGVCDLGRRHLDGPVEGSEELGRARGVLEGAETLEGLTREVVQVDADDAQVDVEAFAAQALRHLSEGRAARLYAVRDQHDHLAALGREVLRGELQRKGDGRGALRLRVPDRLQ